MRVNVIRHPYTTCAAAEAGVLSTAQQQLFCKPWLLEAICTSNHLTADASLWHGDYLNPASRGGAPDHGSAVATATPLRHLGRGGAVSVIPPIPKLT